MTTFVYESDRVSVPSWVTTLEAFRRWADAEDFPETGEICYLKGEVYVDLSDRGLYRSADQGKTWKGLGDELKGRTEWPGCLQLDPTGKTRRLAVALVYGSPVAVAEEPGAKWQAMNGKSAHVAWCAVGLSSALLPGRRVVA